MMRSLISLMALVTSVVTLGCNAAGTSPTAAGVHLVPPQGFTLAVIQSEKEVKACPSNASPFTAALDFPSRYEGSDKARDDVNPRAERKYRELIAPISSLERGLSQQVDDYMRAGNEESLECAKNLLRSWSSANALMGQAVTHTGKSMRKWALASISAAYVRLKFSASNPLASDPQLVAAVDKWLETVARRVVEEWRDQPLGKMNNHEYWAAWGVMAASVATDKRDLFEWSIQQFQIAGTQVDAEGFLPNELARDTRALQYHNYALTPLTMIAAFAKANGREPEKAQREAMDRLSERVLAGMDRPDVFERKTGDKQITADLSEKSKLAWLEPYCWTFGCDAAMNQRLESSRPLKSYRLGGNLTDIFHPKVDRLKRTS